MAAVQFKAIAYLCLLSILIPVLSSEAILLVARLGATEWFAAIIFHACLALGVLGCAYFMPDLFARKGEKHPILKTHPSLVYFPALLVFFVSFSLALMEAEKPYNELPLSFRSFLLIVVVPCAEELVYRLGLTQLFSRIGGRFWGAYFSVLVFAVMHGLPSLDRLLSLELGFYLGPFILAILCELLFGWSNQLFPAILLHMACNWTGVIFSWAGGYWLSVFRFLYH